MLRWELCIKTILKEKFTSNPNVSLWKFQIVSYFRKDNNFKDLGAVLDQEQGDKTGSFFKQVEPFDR